MEGEAMRKKIYTATMVLLVVLFAVSCATLTDKRILRSVDQIETGETELLIKVTQLPFLLDGEIIQRQEEVKLLWGGFREAGFSITNPVILDRHPVTIKDADLFSPSREVALFFEKYLLDNSEVIHLRGDNGEFYLILKGRCFGPPLYRGFKGPM
jgi:hypothetical protein